MVVGDRLSGRVEVLYSTAGTDLEGSAGLVRHLRTFFATFVLPEELSSDGGPEFKASIQRTVQTDKCLLMSNTGPTGGLDHDRFLRAMLQLRNTPDPDCNLSPAQIVFGLPFRDSFSFVNTS